MRRAARLRRHGISHTSARPVADVAHVVDVFVGRPGGDDHQPAEQRAGRRKNPLGGLDDVIRLGEPALADPAAGEIAGAGVDEPYAAVGQRLQVRADGVVLEHVGVHRRSEQHRSARRQIERAEEIVGDAGGELADDVRRRGRDEQQRGVGGQGDVLDVGIGAGRPLRGDDAAPRDGFERHLADETARRARHHRRDLVAALLQAARDFDRLVGADSARYAQRDERHFATPGCRRPSARGPA